MQILAVVLLLLKFSLKMLCHPTKVQVQFNNARLEQPWKLRPIGLINLFQN